MRESLRPLVAAIPKVFAQRLRNGTESPSQNPNSIIYLGCEYSVKPDRYDHLQVSFSFPCEPIERPLQNYVQELLNLDSRHVLERVGLNSARVNRATSYILTGRLGTESWDERTGLVKPTIQVFHPVDRQRKKDNAADFFQALWDVSFLPLKRVALTYGNSKNL